MSDLQRELRDLRDRLDRILSNFERPAQQHRPLGERFDYANENHRMEAEAVFDELEISDRRRSWLYNNVLNDGVHLADLRRVIEDEDATFRRRYPRAAAHRRAVGRRDGTKSNRNYNNYGRRN